MTAEQVPTRDELLAILDAAAPEYRAAIALGACGLRIGEVLGVTEDRIDFDAGTLLVDRQLQMIDGTLQFKRPKREKVRTIALPTWAVLELRRHRRDHGPFWPVREFPDSGGLLFRGGRGAAMRRDVFYDAAWRPALTSAGMPEDKFVFHSFRHWCASAMLSEGAPITAVAGHLGDVVETVGRTYAHWLRDDRELPALLLDRMLQRTPTADQSTG